MKNHQNLSLVKSKNINIDERTKSVLNTYLKLKSNLELNKIDIDNVTKYYYAIAQLAAISKNGGILARSAIEEYVGNIGLLRDTNMRKVFIEQYNLLRNNQDCELSKSI